MEPFLYQGMSSSPYFYLHPWRKEFPSVFAGFSSRVQGEDWHYQNYALHVGDTPQQVIANRRGLAKSLGIPFQSWTCSEQVHGVHIKQVSPNEKGLGRILRDDAIPNTDGMITGEKDIWLTSFYADCVPLYFYCPDIQFIGIAHAGWKGTVGRIGEVLLKKLLQQGAELKKVRVAIGPSIGPCCYEVDQNVITPIKKILGDDSKKIVQKSHSDKWQLDLKEVNRKLLILAGIHFQHIVVSKWCTSCHVKYFFSHRRDRGQTGRMVAWIGLKGDLDG